MNKGKNQELVNICLCMGELSDEQLKGVVRIWAYRHLKKDNEFTVE